MHTHSHSDRIEWRTWMSAFAIQLAVVVIEAFSVPATNSRTLLGDLIHNSSDVLLLILTGVPAIIVALGANPTGFARRWRWVMALVNGSALTFGGLYAIYIGWHALSEPNRAVQYEHAAWVAVASLVGNLLIYFAVRPHHCHKEVRIFGWHQLWDVAGTLVAIIALTSGAHVHLPQLDALASIVIGVGMTLHWPVVALFERNGHDHHH